MNFKRANNSQEDAIVYILQRLQEEYNKQCEPYINQLARIRAARIDPIYIDRKYIDTDKIVIWDNPDLSYDK